MNTGCFHLLPNDDAGLLEQWVCRLATDCYRQGLGVFIYTPDQAQAEAIDERLWQQEADSFVAHNLQGEGPRQGAPVVIGWQPPQGGRAVLINLAPEAPAFARRFGQLHDFVPASDAGKQQARERFKAYRQAGFELTTAPVPLHTQDA
ncbi:DNA polymerase III subunit chi [Oceanimonas sp. GK1]|uniref:DNA polymerase III subunit chi n=1 Tax=Oceanimonas sp. (strain GK1 / IBRC-M 10197) TaxID=511062 RepID=UPI0002494C5F|nr:DNA polymerase III subunit chi [Oceanimonas sp. GK1]AEY00648.1 DNA polymerase III subunit chi [Oceanimonas sp. GK1]